MTDQSCSESPVQNNVGTPGQGLLQTVKRAGENS